MMKNMVTDYDQNQIVLIIIITFQILLLSCQFGEASRAYNKVELLHGFDGTLPFQLETGYVGLGEKDDDMQVFYYFVKSDNNPQKDPLVLWLSGGPGCSSLSSLLIQLGPIKFKIEEYNGSLPTLVLRPESWTKVSSMIFVDLPFGTGFSYAKNATAYRSDWKLVHHVHQFLRKWLVDHPEFLSNSFYFGADSYSGIIVPAVVQEILNGNENGLQPWINFQGYLLGNPITTRREKNYRIPFAHGMELISDELYLSLQRNCKGEYIDVDSENELCLRDMHYFDECISRLERHNILLPYCKEDSRKTKPDDVLHSRSLTQKLDPIISSSLVPDIRCKQVYESFLTSQWANNESVRKALHVREEIREWTRCYTHDYEYDISSSFEIHANLSKKGYRSLIYSGDHDMVTPSMSTQAWIRALNYSIVDDWRPWLVNDQVAGYTRTYSNKMTFATLKGGGHTVGDRPYEAYIMFSRWLSKVPL